jgi:hypothetical protein
MISLTVMAGQLARLFLLEPPLLNLELLVSQPN